MIRKKIQFEITCDECQLAKIRNICFEDEIKTVLNSSGWWITPIPGKSLHDHHCPKCHEEQIQRFGNQS
jgi:predicted RNA-binding Zn-ribbon protein involved in translation (DUF1610 family)